MELKILNSSFKPKVINGIISSEKEELINYNVKFNNKNFLISDLIDENKLVYINNLDFYGDNFLNEIKIMSYLFKCDNLEKEVNELLTLFNLKEIEKKAINYLSKSEKLLLKIIIGSCLKTKVIIIDNLIDCLDNKIIKEVFNYFKEQNNTIFIIYENDPNLIYQYTDYVLIIKNGKKVIHGKTMEVYKNKFMAKNLLQPEIPYLIYMASLKNTKLAYTKDVRDLIKDIYKNVKKY